MNKTCLPDYKRCKIRNIKRVAAKTDALYRHAMPFTRALCNYQNTRVLQFNTIPVSARAPLQLEQMARYSWSCEIQSDNLYTNFENKNQNERHTHAFYSKLGCQNSVDCLSVDAQLCSDCLYHQMAVLGYNRHNGVNVDLHHNCSLYTFLSLQFCRLSASLEIFIPSSNG